jgi:hypothetical protein
MRLRSASRAAIAIEHISNLSHCSRAWFAAGAPLTPTTCGSPSRGRWDARSATNSQFPCAEPITGTTIALATSKPGGGDRRSIPWGHHDSFGFRRGILNDLAARRVLKPPASSSLMRTAVIQAVALESPQKKNRGNKRIRRRPGSEFEIRPARNNTLGPNPGLW